MKENDHLNQAINDLEQRPRKAPDALKEEVFSTLDTIQLFANITDLFTAKYTEANLLVFDLVLSAEMKKEKESDSGL